jgi:glycosyltransferase involved in cell wall biosynthesis
LGHQEFFNDAWFHGQQLAFRLRLLLPGPVRQRLKPLYRRLWRRTSRRRLEELAARRAAEKQTLAGVHLVCFPIIDWELRVQRPQQLLARLAARGATVHYLRNDFHPGRALQRATLAGGIDGIRLPGSHRINIYRSEPPAGAAEPWLDLLATLDRAGRSDRTIALVHWPFWAPLALAARQKWGWPVVYDCIDDHAAFPGAPQWLRSQEDALLRHSDLVVAASGRLYERCAGATGRRVLIANAGDFEHFCKYDGDRKLGSLHGPVIGYFGALSGWFGSEMVEAAARRHPEWSFVLIGLAAGAGLAGIDRLANVHLIGEQPYEELPGFLHRFDVAMIPFRPCELASAVNPIKFYEYLAAGKPVVASCLPELAPHRELYYAADTPEEFTAALERAVTEDDAGPREKRVAFASRHRWQARVDSFEEELLRLVDRLGPGSEAPAQQP